MDISRKTDVTKGAPDFNRGTNPFDNKGIQPTKVSDTPGERATNPAAETKFSKAQPFGKGGSGYTG